jgi:hypothetical protein
MILGLAYIYLRSNMVVDIVGYPNTTLLQIVFVPYHSRPGHERKARKVLINRYNQSYPDRQR